MSEWIVLPVAVLAVTFAVLVLVLKAVRVRYRRRKLRLPFTDALLRAPGHSLLQRIDAVGEEVQVQLICAVLQPILAYAVIMTYLWRSQSPRVEFIAVTLAACALMLAYCLRQTVLHLNTRRRLRLDYDGEVVVGQALNQLMRRGYHVYHDFPADKFTIDHVLVGPKGVFAVETRTRFKSTSSKRTEDATVAYNGHALFFPDWTDEETIGQVERRTEWLSQWLDSAIGDPVAARGVVAIPGWFVKRTTSDGIPVVNPKQFASLFEHIKPRSLTDEQITRIVHQLEQKCRDDLALAGF